MLNKPIVIEIDKPLDLPIHSVQFDKNSRFIDVYLLNNSLPLDVTRYTVTVAGIKPDGTSFFNECSKVTPQEGLVRFEVTEQMNVTTGIVKCELKIYNDSEGVLTTKPFDIKVTRSLLKSDIESTSEFQALTEAISKVQEFDNKLFDMKNDYHQKIIETNTQLSNSIHYVTYEMFGAKGNGVTDDSQAIKNAHDYANQYGYSVKANGAKTYYIKDIDDIFIKTNVNWHGAKFIIDDTRIGINRKNPIFRVISNNKTINIDILDNVFLTKKTDKMDILSGYGLAFVEIINEKKRHFIRKGHNANIGEFQQDHLIVDNEGNIMTCVNWDFDNISLIKLRKIDDNCLKIENAEFLTISNDGDLDTTYYERGILIERDNVTVTNISHHLIDEKPGSPYNGFIHAQSCYNFKLIDSKLTPHIVYKNASTNISMGTYDIRLDKVIKGALINIDGMTLESGRWGIMGSNYCKDFVIEKSALNRVDAHLGITNLTIRDCEIGEKGVQIVGQGMLKIESSKFIGHTSLVTLRSDYGSTWDGDIIIKDVMYKPGSMTYPPKIINFVNDGTHDFGYNCYYPNVYVENLYIDDSLVKGNGYYFMYLIENTAERIGDISNINYKYPYFFSKNMVFKNIRTASGKGFKFAYHPRNLVSRYPFSYEIVDEIPDGANLYKRLIIKTNLRVLIDNIDLPEIELDKISELTSHIFHSVSGVLGNDDYYDKNKLNKVVPRFEISNCNNIHASVGSTLCEVFLENCKIRQIVNTSGGGSLSRGSAKNCVLVPKFDSIMCCTKLNYLDFIFENCIFDKFDIPDSDKFTREDMWTIYSFLVSLKAAATNTHIFTKCNLINCSIHPSISIDIIEPSHEDFNFDFNRNFTFEYFPRHRGVRSYMPKKNEGYTIPVGMLYWITTDSSFERWNGENWV